MISAVLLLLAGTAVLTSCARPAGPSSGTSLGTSAEAPLAEIVLEIPTISCAGCWPRIEASAKSVPGVREVKFEERRIQRVTVVYDPSLTTPETIIQAIEKRGDKVKRESEQ